MSAVGAACRYVPLALALAATVAAPFLARAPASGPPPATSVAPAAGPGAGSEPAAATREASEAHDLAGGDLGASSPPISGGDAYLPAILEPSMLPYPEQPLARSPVELREPTGSAPDRAAGAISEAGSLPILGVALLALALAGRGAALRVRSTLRLGRAPARAGRADGST